MKLKRPMPMHNIGRRLLYAGIGKVLRLPLVLVLISPKHLDKFYNEASAGIKQKIVGLNFPEKLIYENGRIQIPQMNEVLSLILLEDEGCLICPSEKTIFCY